MVIPPNFSPAETPPGEEWISWAAAQRMAAAWLLSRTRRRRNLRRRPAQQRRHQRQSHSNAGGVSRQSFNFVCFWWRTCQALRCQHEILILILSISISMDILCLYSCPYDTTYVSCYWYSTLCIFTIVYYHQKRSIMDPFFLNWGHPAVSTHKTNVLTSPLPPFVIGLSEYDLYEGWRVVQPTQLHPVTRG